MSRHLSLGLLLAVVIAAALRCPELDLRPMHNDEAVNGVKFARLLNKGEYKYDPLEHHGPSLPYFTLAIERLTAAPDVAHYSDSRLRMVTVIFGLGAVMLITFLADGLGVKASAWAALFAAVSPVMVFYSRYYIHETVLVFFTLLTLAFGWKYYQTRHVRWALLAGAAIGLMQTTKETWVLTLGTAGLAMAANHWISRKSSQSVRPVHHPLHILAGAGVMVGVWVLFFSSFGTNLDGPIDALRTYQAWFHRAGGTSEHLHPWYFYLNRLLYFHEGKGPIWTEGFILLFALVGAWSGFKSSGKSASDPILVRFLSLNTILLVIVYSAIPYKTPWCVLTFWLGAILLAGVGATFTLECAVKPMSKRLVIGILIAGACNLGLMACLANTTYASDRRNPWVYAETSPDVLKLVAQIQSLANLNAADTNIVVKVIAPEDDYWPLPWYLRNLKRVGWWNQVPPDPYAPVMLVSARLHAQFDEDKTHAMVGYFALRPDVFMELYVKTNLWQEWLAQNAAMTNH